MISLLLPSAGRVLGCVVALELSFIASAADYGLFQMILPAEAPVRDGNDASLLPFQSEGNERWQQVYEARFFSAVPKDGAFVRVIEFRPDCLMKRGSGAVHTNVTLTLSTTSRREGGLSPVFEENIGPDAVVVYGPKLYAMGFGSSGQADCGGNPWPLDYYSWLALKEAFFYQPSRGNLLLDIQVYDYWAVAPNGFAIDVFDNPGDGVSSISGSAPSMSGPIRVASAVTSRGLVTRFDFIKLPSITNSVTTTNLVLSWGPQTPGFVLEWADSLEAGAAWRAFSGQIECGDLVCYTSIPLTELARNRFFRLRYGR